jgi:hypothetical protein
MAPPSNHGARPTARVAAVFQLAKQIQPGTRKTPASSSLRSFRPFQIKYSLLDCQAAQEF